MNADDLTKPLNPMPRKRRHGIVLPIVVATLAGVFSGWLILFDAAPDRGKPSLPASVPEPALAETVQQTAAVPAPTPSTPTAKTITLTVIDSQTGAKREVIVPARTDDQLEEGKPAPRSAAPTPSDTATARGAARQKRH